jgi:hypothetical protein
MDTTIFTLLIESGWVPLIIIDQKCSFLYASSERVEAVVALEIAEAVATHRLSPRLRSDCLSLVQQLISRQVERSLCGPVMYASGSEPKFSLLASFVMYI